MKRKAKIAYPAFSLNLLCISSKIGTSVAIDPVSITEISASFFPVVMKVMRLKQVITARPIPNRVCNSIQSSTLNL